MAGLREIKRRIKAVKSTAQVTRAMQLVAASKMKHAQQAAVNSRPYAQLLAEIFSTIDPSAIASLTTFNARKEVKKRGILVIGPDKGLCGGLLTNLNREIMHLPADALYVAVGKRPALTLARLGRNVLAEFHLSDRARFVELRGAVELMLKSFENGECDTFEVLYSQFISPIKQIPTLETILPLTDVSSILNTFVKEYTAAAPIKDDARPFIIEPSIKEVLAGLIPLYIKQEIYHTALEAKASEHSARMVAMKNATDNANQLAADLNLSYNKARQAAITNEILEIAAAQSAGGN